MSGIAGIICFDGAPVEPGSIQKLTSFMAPLGPDEQTHWMQGSVALGHCMLRTTPESIEEHQPLFSQDKRLVLVWDGRLDNREDLQRELHASGAIIRNKSDAELALQSYVTWGSNSPGHLLGDFTFAVWDARQHRLFCARDHMGARPIYYTVNNRFFAFASQDEALCLLMGGKPRPNEELIAYSLVPEFKVFAPGQTWLKDIWPVPAATSIAVSQNGQVSQENYWALQPAEESVFSSAEECQRAFLDIFGEAVRCRMRSSSPVSAMMSGGLDSASIIAMVKRLQRETPGQNIHTFSAISDSPESCIETQCIQSLTRELGKNAHFVSVPSFTGMLNVQDLIDTAWSKAHPVDNSMLLPLMMFLAAKREGHRVMLHGMGGDLTTYVPNQYIALLLKERKFLDAFKACQANNRNNTYLSGTSPLRQLLSNALVAYTPRNLKPFARRLRGLVSKSPVTESLINPAFAMQLNLANRLKAARQPTPVSVQGLQQSHIKILSHPHGITSGLSGYNRIASRYGLELRDPWSDRRVIEFFLRLPLEYKIQDGWTKYLVRTAFAADLEPIVRCRKTKEHLGWNFAWRLLDETESFVAQTLEDHLNAVKCYIDIKAVREMHTRAMATKGFDERISVYDIMTLILWVRRISD